MSTIALRAAAPVAVLVLLTSQPGAALSPAPQGAYGPTPFTLAAVCDPAQPLVSMNVLVRNPGTTATAPATIVASDAANVLAGQVALNPVAPGAQLALNVPMRKIAGSTGAITGPHVVAVTLGTQQLAPITVVIPAGFCGTPAPPAATPVAASTPALSGTLKTPQRPPVGTVSAMTARATIAPYSRAKPVTVAAALAVAAPTGVRGASGGQDCAVHTGVLGALVCPDMIKSGNLLLVWDWAPGAGPAQLDGYRVYRVDGGKKQLVDTVINKQSFTLSDVPKPAGGYTGRCFAVTAFAASRESALSQAFCASGGSVAKTMRLSATHVRSSEKAHNTMGNFVTGRFGGPQNLGPLQVGFTYESTAHTLGDEVHNYLHRGAVAFDVSSLKDRKLVSAKLHLQLSGSVGAGNNHSCITEIGTGTEFWWQNESWIEGQFGAGVVPTDTGPDVTADVTQLVAPWLRGEPNYGFVLRNSDENLGAFTNKACDSGYAAPSLEITYY